MLVHLLRGIAAGSLGQAALNSLEAELEGEETVRKILGAQRRPKVVFAQQGLPPSFIHGAKIHIWSLFIFELDFLDGGPAKAMPSFFM